MAEQSNTIRFDSAWNGIISGDLQAIKVAGGFQFVEGPVWDRQRGYLYFSDIPANRIYTWSPQDGVQLFREPSGNSNGLTLDRQGSLLACEHGNRRVSATDDDGSVRTLVERFEGKRLNSPNDIVVKSDGSLYFTDPPYGLTHPAEQELPYQGIYRLLPESGAIELLCKERNHPNGLCFSSDERILYVDDSSTQDIYAYDVADDGTIHNGRLFARLDPSFGAGVPDGLKVDVRGNVYVTGPGGIWVLDPAGTPLGVIRIPEVAANLGWGGDEHRTLFITATTSLYKIETINPGIRHGN
ncbi:SMP-30/gluconolactonase/LRE family protein [Paenibacillus mendelii]|uniref:SMP-30/gluconolactonase/LRE family protein n=1 Tax=Paenibacillus mendelii TaxID=206163 RepID=A0ABV6J415_9BACL|nr:SMP-30/gluconolactonase/LRE family protein [Paenibacillus mendelii]MCQ6559314.1 SMP-30/gluconolactonase/LRE family protein [Paenibacillus mendelii]